MRGVRYALLFVGLTVLLGAERPTVAKIVAGRATTKLDSVALTQEPRAFVSDRATGRDCKSDANIELAVKFVLRNESGRPLVVDTGQAYVAWNGKKYEPEPVTIRYSDRSSETFEPLRYDIPYLKSSKIAMVTQFLVPRKELENIDAFEVVIPTTHGDLHFEFSDVKKVPLTPTAEGAVLWVR